jgi:hypothetical protein
LGAFSAGDAVYSGAADAASTDPSTVSKGAAVGGGVDAASSLANPWSTVEFTIITLMASS